MQKNSSRNRDSVLYLWQIKEATLLAEHTCADPGIFVRGGGGGGPGQSDKKKEALTTLFFVFVFCSYSSAYFTEVKWSISKKSIIFQGSRGGPIFSRGVSNFFQGWSNCLFPIETHITCDFPGGGGQDPLSPPSGSALGIP